MIYAMSDIHGFLDIFQENLKRIDLSGESRLMLLGDYIDYGPESGQTLRYIHDLQRRHGQKKVVVLRGNHEEAFLKWLDAYGGPHAGEADEYGFVPFSDWLDKDPDYSAFRSLVTEEQWEFFQKIARTTTGTTQNIEAARMVLSSNGELIRWLRGLPYYCETERQIFVHAGIDEEAGKWWYGAEEYIFISKFPASTGSFYKDIIAGHISTARISGAPNFHGVYHDGQSHYYIDGTVNESGRIPILAYEEEKGTYSEIG